MLEILPKLSKKYILDHITQEDIFQRYLGIPVTYGDTICVPAILRGGKPDHKPSGGFRWAGHKLRFKDFSGHFWGDCFDAVGVIIGENPNDKQGFMNVLIHIAKEFRLHDYANGNHISVIPRLTSTGNIPVPKARKVIEITVRLWNKDDANYWMPFCIHKKALDYFDVYPCQTMTVGDYYYTYNPADPAYAYYEGRDENGVNLFQIYFPFRKENKFIMNCAPIFGLNKIKGAEVGVITKSKKDVMSIKCITHGKFSVEAIAPSSESHVIPKDVIADLWTKYGYIVTLMDFDFAGRNMAWKLKSLYGLPPLFFVNGTRGTKYNHGSKDFSAYVKNNGRAKTIDLVNNALVYIRNKFDKKRSNGKSTVMH